MLSRWSRAFQIGAVYAGTVVGAGFATGKEIVEFFTRFGFIGFLGILLAGYIFIALGIKMMIISSRIGARTYKEFNEYLFGKKYSKPVNFFMLIMLIGVTAVLVSGADALFEEQLGLPKSVGTILTIVMAVIVLMLGMKGLLAVNSFVVPMMIFFSLMLCFFSLKNGGTSFIASVTEIPKEGYSWKALIAPFSYTALNLTLAQAVLVPVASEVNDEKMIKRGGILGGLFLTIILLSSHFALMSLEDPSFFEIPTAVLMQSVAPKMFWIFIMVIYGEIFTSVIGNVFGLEKQVRIYFSLPKFLTLLGIMAIVYFISRIQYGTLLAFLYPVFGYISLLMLFLLWRKKT